MIQRNPGTSSPLLAALANGPSRGGHLDRIEAGLPSYCASRTGKPHRAESGARNQVQGAEDAGPEVVVLAAALRAGRKRPTRWKRPAARAPASCPAAASAGRIAGLAGAWLIRASAT